MSCAVISNIIQAKLSMHTIEASYITSIRSLQAYWLFSSSKNCKNFGYNAKEEPIQLESSK